MKESEIKYIYWQKEAKYEKITKDEFNEKFNFYKDNGTFIEKKTIRINFIKNKNPYFFERKNNYCYLYTNENGKKIIYFTNWYDDNKNLRPLQAGTAAIQALSKKFLSRTNLTLCKAFGTSEEAIKKCIPFQLTFTNIEYLNRVIKSISAIDGCSWYPAHMTKDLPTSKDCIQLEGTHKPTKEYPFAFYIKSGHSAEYNEYDTHDWLKSPLKRRLFKELPVIKEEEDITILMKSSGYNLKEEYEYFYELRKTDEEAKLVMNASIGMMHKNTYTSYKYAHLAVVALCRANNDHLKMIDKIGIFNVIHICVDGIIYKGSAIFGENNKKLGIYHQEFTNCDGIIRGMNAYIIKNKKGDIEKVKHGAYNKNLDGSDIDESKIKDFNEINNWIKVDPLLEGMKQWEKENIVNEA